MQINLKRVKMVIFLLAGGRYCDSVLPVILITPIPTEVIVKLNWEFTNTVFTCTCVHMQDH